MYYPPGRFNEPKPRRRLPFYSLYSLLALCAVCFVGSVAPAVAQGQGKSGKQGYALGAILSPPSAFKRNSRFLVKAASPSERPDHLLLTAYLPPVKSQGGQGSCVGWASAYYSYTYAVARQRHLTSADLEQEKWQFSPAFIYNQNNRGEDSGMGVYKAFEFLKAKGCCSLAEMPYSDRDYTKQPGADADKRAANFVAFEVASLVQGPGSFDGETVRTFLNDLQQPVTLAIPIYTKFPGRSQSPPGPFDGDYVYHHTDGDLEGYHAITIIGYDDRKHAFRMVNSWGPNWGDKGQLWLDEDFLKQEARDGWGMVAPGGGRARVAKTRLIPLTRRVQIELPQEGAK